GELQSLLAQIYGGRARVYRLPRRPRDHQGNQRHRQGANAVREVYWALIDPRSLEARSIMGLTVYYDWKVKSNAKSARRMIAKFHAIAQKLPFDKVSEIYEQDPPDNHADFRIYDGSFRQGDLFLSR